MALSQEQLEKKYIDTMLEDDNSTTAAAMLFLYTPEFREKLMQAAYDKISQDTINFQMSDEAIADDSKELGGDITPFYRMELQTKSQ